MIKAAIFDLDGTLLDSLAIWENAGAIYLGHRGIDVEEDLGRKLFPLTIEQAAEYLKGHYLPQEDTRTIIAGVLGEIRDFYLYDVELKPGAAELLEHLERAGVPMAAATSGDGKLARAALERLGVRKYFKEIYTCTEVGAGKDQPRIYQRAAQCLQAGPEDTWVFEDALHAIQTAKAAGFVTVGVYDPFHKNEREEIRREADYYLENLSDCVDLMGGKI